MTNCFWTYRLVENPNNSSAFVDQSAANYGVVYPYVRGKPRPRRYGYAKPSMEFDQVADLCQDWPRDGRPAVGFAVAHGIADLTNCHNFSAIGAVVLQGLGCVPTTHRSNIHLLILRPHRYLQTNEIRFH